MKNYTQKWKELNKNGIKLSLICGLNLLIKFLFKGQFYLFSAVFLGLLTYYMPQDIQLFTVRVLELIVMFKITTDVIYTIFSKEIRRLKKPLLLGVMSLFFLAGNVYIKQHTLTEFLVNRLFTFWFISLVLTILVIILQPRLFKHYLFKNVLDKTYLGIRKTTDELPPKRNLYTDSDEKDADKRIKMMNQHVIKKPYQGVVELSFLNREVITGIGYKTVPFEKEKERSFVDVDTIYYPIFRVYPFGITGDFGYALIKFKLSRKAAFTKSSEGLLKKYF